MDQSYDKATAIMRVGNNKYNVEAQVLMGIERPEFLIGEIGENFEYDKIYIRRFKSARTRPIWVRGNQGFARQRVFDTMYVVQFPIVDIPEEFSIQLGYSEERFLQICQQN